MLVWFRRDLELTDNPAVAETANRAETSIRGPIHAPEEAGNWQPVTHSQQHVPYV